MLLSRLLALATGAVAAAAGVTSSVGSATFITAVRTEDNKTILEPGKKNVVESKSEEPTTTLTVTSTSTSTSTRPRTETESKSESKGTPTATPTPGGSLPPSCGVEACLPSGIFYGCTPSNFPCICTKERRFVDEYMGMIASCVAARKGCTEGGMHTFMQAFQDTCAHVGNPITAVPSPIQTWLMTSLLTGYTPSASTTITRTSSLGPSTSTITALPTPTSSLHHHSSGLSASAKSGIGVGVVTAVIATVFILTVVLLRRRRHRRQKHAVISARSPSAPPLDDSRTPTAAPVPTLELPATEKQLPPPSELEAELQSPGLAPPPASPHARKMMPCARDSTVSELDGRAGAASAAGMARVGSGRRNGNGEWVRGFVAELDGVATMRGVPEEAKGVSVKEEPEPEPEPEVKVKVKQEPEVKVKREPVDD